MTPSSSPTIQSPGLTVWPAITIGTLISPKPLGSPALAQTLLLKAAKPVLAISGVSRIAPQTTSPARPLTMALWVASSPHIAGVASQASTTSTSPGLQTSIASTGLAQSPA